jgi:hypothetical protein
MSQPDQSQSTTQAWRSTPTPTANRRRSVGCVIVPIITLLIGIGLGFVILFLYVLYVLQSLSNVPAKPPVPGVPPPSSGDIVVQISPAFMVKVLKPMLQNELNDFPLPSTIQLPLPCNVPVPVSCGFSAPVPSGTRLKGTFNNVQIQLSDSDRTGSVQVTTIAYGEVTVSSALPVIGSVSSGNIPVTIMIQTQLFAQNGILNSNVRSATITLNGRSFSILSMMLSSLVEHQIDQQLQIKTRDLPPGFVYHITGIRSNPENLSVTIEATPMA